MFNATLFLSYDDKTSVLHGGLSAVTPDFTSVVPLILTHVSPDHAENFLAAMHNLHGKHVFTSIEGYEEFIEKVFSTLLLANRGLFRDHKKA